MLREKAKTVTAILFILSGVSGLIYQIVWFKYLHLFLGNTTYAQMIVLAAFLGGLALGNNYFGNRAERISNHLRYYGILEIFIALYCFLFPTLIEFTGTVFLSLVSSQEMESSFLLLNATRFIISALLLIVPTIAMGGTLPILSKFFVERISDARRDIGILYFFNSFGAVIGVFFAGFILIKEFGLVITNYSAATINLLIGLAAFYVSTKVSPPDVEGFSSEEEEVSEIALSKKIIIIIIAVSGISGFASLLYEMVWVRLLVNFLGSSTYAFSVMLISFIGGITLGGWLISKSFFNKYDKVKAIAVFQLIIAFSTMLSLILYDRLPYYLWKISSIFSKTPEAFNFFLLSEFLLCFLLMIIPTIFMGMTLPACTEIISKSNKKIGFSVGRIFSINTLGTVFGILTTGLVFIPWFGIKGAFEFGIAVNVFAAILILTSLSSISFKLRTSYSLCSLLVFIIYLFSFSSWDKSIILSGVFRKFSQSPPESFEEFRNLFSNEKIVYYKEGISSTVAVTHSKDTPQNRRLIINGKPDASSYYDMPTQVLIGQIPLMLHPNPKNVFVVGLGSGTTIGSVLTHPVEKVVCAEISKEVIEASDFFKKENYGCLEDKRLKLYNEDALTLLKTTKESFDVIISEPSNPWIAGIGNLFSQEYFKICYDKLSADGIMVQWFHLYEMNDEVIKLVLNTFESVFPNAQVWNSVANDIVLVGTKKNYEPIFSSIVEKFNREKVKRDFGRININNLFTFLSCQFVSSRGLFFMTNKEPINKEIHPKLEFLAPKAFYLSQPSSYIYGFDERYDSVSMGLLIKDYVNQYPVTIDNLVNTIEYHTNISKTFRLAFGLSRMLNQVEPKSLKIRQLYLSAYENFDMNNKLSLLEQTAADFPNSQEAIRDYTNALLFEKINASTFFYTFSLEQEAHDFKRIEAKDSVSQARVNIQLAKAFFLNSEFDLAYKYISMAEKMILGNPTLKFKVNIDDYLYINAMVSLYRRDFERVFTNYLALINNNPQYENLNRLRKSVEWVVQKKNKL